MLFRKALNDELEKRNDDLRESMERYSRGVGSYLERIEILEGSGASEVVARLSQIEDPGAIPSSELDRGSLSIDFPHGWKNHEHARDWAAGILHDRTTFAADGSQIYTGKETVMPIAAVQIGWFENPHNAETSYEKNATFKLLTPADLLTEWEEPMNPDIRVEAARYLGEVERISSFMDRRQGWRDRGERMPLAFFDNPLLVPFSQKGLQKKFLDATVQLVERSQQARVPVVGYVDRSFSRDILTMLDRSADSPVDEGSGLFDASLLRGRRTDGSRLLESWGERTCFFYAARRGLDAFKDPSTGQSRVGFVYLQTTSDSAPARLDIPSWIFDEGLLDELVDTVRAECVIGLGYPYVLESADQAAVISTRDREVFFRALQELTSRGKLDFSVTRKEASKKRRR
jgi:hypothetical protein